MPALDPIERRRQEILAYPTDLHAADVSDVGVDLENPGLGPMEEIKTPWEHPHSRDTMEVRGSEQPQQKKVQDDSKKGHGLWSDFQETVVDFFDWVKNSLFGSDDKDSSLDGKGGRAQGNMARPESTQRRDNDRLYRMIQQANAQRRDDLRDEFNAEKCLAMLFRTNSELRNVVMTIGAQEIETNIQRRMELRKQGQKLTDEERKLTKSRGIADTVRNVLAITTGVAMAALGISTGNIPLAIASASVALYKVGRAGFDMLPKKVQRQITMETKGKNKKESVVRKYIRAGLALLDMGADTFAAVVAQFSGKANPVMTALSAVDAVTNAGIKGYYGKKSSEHKAARAELKRKDMNSSRELRKTKERISNAEENLHEWLRAARQIQSKKTEFARMTGQSMAR